MVCLVSMTLSEVTMIYFVQAAAGPIKIGFTDQANINRRLLSLQHGTYERLTLMLVVAGDLAAEDAVHTRFRSLRIRGEWFRADASLLAYIESRRVDALPIPVKTRGPSAAVQAPPIDWEARRKAESARMRFARDLLAQALAADSIETVAARLGVSVRYTKYLANRVVAARWQIPYGSAERAIRVYGTPSQAVQ